MSDQNQNLEENTAIVVSDPTATQSTPDLDSMPDFLATLFGVPTYTAEEKATIEEATKLINELKERYNADAIKLSTLLQMAADVATRVAFETEDASAGDWPAARNALINKERNRNRRTVGEAIPYVGGYTPTDAHRVEVEALGDALSLKQDEIGVLVSPAVEHIHSSMVQGLTGFSEAYVAAAYAGHEEGLALHYAKVHAEENDALAAVKERLQWAREWGLKKAREESADCESNHAAEVAADAEGQA